MVEINIIEGEGMLNTEQTIYPENSFTWETEGPDDRDTVLKLKTVATLLAQSIKDRFGAEPWDMVFYQENGDWTLASNFDGDTTRKVKSAKLRGYDNIAIFHLFLRRFYPGSFNARIAKLANDIRGQSERLEEFLKKHGVSPTDEVGTTQKFMTDCFYMGVHFGKLEMDIIYGSKLKNILKSQKAAREKGAITVKNIAESNRQECTALVELALQTEYWRFVEASNKQKAEFIRILAQKQMPQAFKRNGKLYKTRWFQEKIEDLQGEGKLRELYEKHNP